MYVLPGVGMNTIAMYIRLSADAGVWSTICLCGVLRFTYTNTLSMCSLLHFPVCGSVFSKRKLDGYLIGLCGVCVMMCSPPKPSSAFIYLHIAFHIPHTRV